MAYDFLFYTPEQAFLLPQTPRDWLPEGNLALFLQDTVSTMDLSVIPDQYPGGRGPKAYHPQMLLSVLLYGYATDAYRSRKLAAWCETDIASRMLAAEQAGPIIIGIATESEPSTNGATNES